MPDNNLRRTLTEIADAIRDRLAIDNYPIKPINFATEIFDIPQQSGGAHYDDPAPIIEGTIDYCSNDATAIKPYTFAFCDLLSGVDFPNCKTIGSRTFYSCATLTELSFPECEVIGDSAFYTCRDLSSVYFPKCEVISSYAFQSCPGLKSIDFPKVKDIKSNAFCSCSKLASINIPEVEIIDYSAFYNCFNLSGDIYLSNCKRVSQYAFAYCSKIKSIDLPECYYLDYLAFFQDSRISSVNLPKCYSINNPFSNWYASYSLPRSYTFPRLIYAAELFNSYGDTITYFEAPNLVVAYGGFDISVSNSYPNLVSCYTLSLVVSPEGVVNNDIIFNSNIRAYGSIYKEITLPGVRALTNNGFSSCSSLTKISMPALTSMDTGYAFANCSALSEIFFPQLGSFSNSTFSNCKALEKIIIIRSDVYANGSAMYTFSNTPITNSTYLGYYGSIYVLPQYLDKYKASAGWSRVKDRITAISNPEFYDEYYIYETQFYRNSSITEIPVEKLNASMVLPSAFAYCSNLLSVNLPSCSILGDYVFYQCSKLTTVSLPQVKYLNNSVFAYCSSLSSIYLPEALIIHSNAIAWCSSLTYVSLPKCKALESGALSQNKALSSIYLPECVYLGMYTLAYCSNLSYCALPKLLYLGGNGSSGAFRGCNNLWSLYLLGSVPTALPGTDFENTPIMSSYYSEAEGASAYGSIFVRASLVSDWIELASYLYSSANASYRIPPERFVGVTDEEADAISNVLNNGGDL